MCSYKFKIKNLDCANELERALQKISFLHDVSIHFFTETFTFSCEEERKEEAMKLILRVIRREAPDVEVEKL